jgi:hypothetical protein
VPRVACLGTNRRRRTFSTKSSFGAPLRGRNTSRFHGDPRRREIMRDTAQTERARRAGLRSQWRRVCWV